MKKIFILFAASAFSLTGALAQSISNFSPTAYSENDGWKYLDQSVTVSSSSNWDGGFIEFDVTNVNDTKDEFKLLAGTTYSLSGRTLKNSSNEILGEIDATYDGTAGKKLRINFSSPFTNASFEDDLTGWTIVGGRINLGSTVIAGYTTQESDPYPGNVPNRDNNAPASASYSYELSTTEKTSGTKSLRLYSSMTTSNDCDVVHGPGVYSSPFDAVQGDKIYFDWRAVNGGDDYDIFGYIVNTSNGAVSVILNQNGGQTSWATANVTIPTTGTYRFVFVNGTHDKTCGRAAGASLYIDNVKVFGNKVTNAIVEDIIENVQFRNDCGNQRSNRTIRIQAATGTSSTISASGTMTFSTTPPVARANNISIQLSNATGTASITAAQVDNGSYDADCGLASISLSKTTFTCSDIGTNNVTFTATDRMGATATTTIVVTVQPNTFVTSEPVDSTTCPGVGASYSIVASGYNLNYQWQINKAGSWANVVGSNYTGVNTPTLKLITTDTFMDFHKFRCVVGGCNFDTSAVATQRVYRLPLITVEPVQPEIKCGNDSVVWQIGSYGSQLSYVWERDTGTGWHVLPGDTTINYKVVKLNTTMNGHRYRCIVNGICSPPDTSLVRIIRVRGNQPRVDLNQLTKANPGQADGATDVSISEYNQYLRYTRWSAKSDTDFPEAPNYDMNNAIEGAYYLMVVTKEHCVYYEGPYYLQDR